MIFFTFWTEMLLQQPLHPLKELIRHIAEREVQERGGSDYRAVVREHTERLLAMVGRHARLSYAAERQILVGNVHDGVVDAATAR